MIKTNNVPPDLRFDHGEAGKVAEFYAVAVSGSHVGSALAAFVRTHRPFMARN